MRRLIALCALLAACGTGRPATRPAPGAPPAVDLDPAVTESLEVQPYPVSGQDPGAIRRSIDAARPAADDDREHYDAVTVWVVSWHYNYARGPNGCGPADPAVRLALRMQLPALGDAPAAARAPFDRYLAALRVHEEGHVRLDRAVANTVAALVRDFPPRADCETLARELNRAAGRALEDGRAQNRAYDARTQHGVAQGARFP